MEQAVRNEGVVRARKNEALVVRDNAQTELLQVRNCMTCF